MVEKALGVAPFCGVRFDFERTRLSDAICPPYDVLTRDIARRLRRLPHNAIHLEAPSGGSHLRYRRAFLLWKRWRARGVLVQDERPAFYVVEQSFRSGGGLGIHRRMGVLAALGVDEVTAQRLLPHERTLPNPKKDRLALLELLKVNTSPIFAIYENRGGGIRRVLRKASSSKPLAAGRNTQGVSFRLWRLDAPETVSGLAKALSRRKLLIADGHHRYEVAREYWVHTRTMGAERTLAYLVADEDPGLIVDPAHRVIGDSKRVREAIDEHCVARPMGGLRAVVDALERARSPYTFGLYDGRFHLLRPAPGDEGVPSRFGTAWLSRRLLGPVDAQQIQYCHGAEEAVRRARASKGLAFLVKPFTVKDIRRAVERIGLLPQKSTYFHPKVPAGLVFRDFS